MSALTNGQKAHLAQLARNAFNKTGAQLRGAGVMPTGGTLQGDLELLAMAGTNAGFEDWRHSQVRMAVGKEGLRCCDQMDYKRVEAHFVEMLGQHGRALNAHLRAETEPRRQAMAKLNDALQRTGLHWNYAAAICQRAHRCNLNDAPVGVIWKVIYTINNRGNAKRRKALAA